MCEAFHMMRGVKNPAGHHATDVLSSKWTTSRLRTSVNVAKHPCVNDKTTKIYRLRMTAETTQETRETRENVDTRGDLNDEKE